VPNANRQMLRVRKDRTLNSNTAGIRVPIANFNQNYNFTCYWRTSVILGNAEADFFNCWCQVADWHSIVSLTEKPN
jgi:hypothetical protein